MPSSDENGKSTTDRMTRRGAKPPGDRFDDLEAQNAEQFIILREIKSEQAKARVEQAQRDAKIEAEQASQRAEIRFLSRVVFGGFGIAATALIGVACKGLFQQQPVRQPEPAPTPDVYNLPHKPTVRSERPGEPQLP